MQPERRIRLSPTEREDVGMLLRHRDAVYRNNEHLITVPHDLEVARYSAIIAVKKGLPSVRMLMATEAGLLHDVGKNEEEIKAYLECKKYLTLSQAEKEYVRDRHTKMGPVMLEQVDFTHMVSTRPEMEIVCLHHHDSQDTYLGMLKDLIAVIQVADSFVVSTIGGGHHVFCTKQTPEQALSDLYSGAENGYFDLPCIDALRVSQGISLN
jgi:hypothetical protein